MVVSTRAEAESSIAKALSRHIGYTSGAYDLDRIFRTLQIFETKTSAYRDEVISFLGVSVGKESASSEYLADIISFATSMGLLEAVSARDARLPRFAATEIGRSILGAKATGDSEFYRFFMSKIVLAADADFILPILLYHQSGDRSKTLIAYFSEFTATLRGRRRIWLVETFPERVLFERVASQIPWLKRTKGLIGLYGIDLPTSNTARHHATPRNKWIEQLRMFDSATSTLTGFGLDVARSLGDQNTYFWLAPPHDVLSNLGILNPPQGLPEDLLEFSYEGISPTEEDILNLIGNLKATLILGYNAAKLIHAPQASLRLAVEYVSYRSYVEKKSYDWVTVLDRLFAEHKSSIQRYSARKGKIGFYRPVNV